MKRFKIKCFNHVGEDKAKSIHGFKAKGSKEIKISLEDYCVEQNDTIEYLSC